MAFKTRQWDEGDVHVCALSGEVDERSYAEFQEMVRTLVSASKSSLLLDFSHLEVIGAHSLRTLLTTQERLRADGRHMALCGVSPRVRKGLDVAKVAHRFPIQPSRRAALEWLRKNRRAARVSRLAKSLLSVDRRPRAGAPPALARQRLSRAVARLAEKETRKSRRETHED